MAPLTSDFEYHLPPELIAAAPADPRDASRLLVVHRDTGEFEEAHFRDVGRWLRPRDLLVANNSRVFPARLFGHRHGTGGKVEVLLTEQIGDTEWLCLCRPAAKLKQGEHIVFDDNLRAEVIGHRGPGERVLRFTWDGEWWPLIDRLGHVPLPPYITGARQHRGVAAEVASDRARYQTVYARGRGSVAAPTAGLHFTPGLISDLQSQGIGWAEVTLHVGLGTFLPVTTEDPAEHVMHEEAFTLSENTADQINATRSQGGRIVAVGTTSVRVLESCADARGRVTPQSGRTRLFLLPGDQFRSVDALITNFHLPRSTLLMLVCAFAGRELILRAYAHAAEQRFRFYSYGDAMLIL